MRMIKKAVACMLVITLVVAGAFSGNVISVNAKSNKTLYSASSKRITMNVGEKRVVTVVWKGKGSLKCNSSNKSVANASVTRKGKKRHLMITGNKAGKTTITLTGKKPSKKLKFVVTVKSVAELSCYDADKNLTFMYNSSGIVFINYTGAGMPTVETQNPQIANAAFIYHNGEEYELEINALKDGETIITVQAPDVAERLELSLTVIGDENSAALFTTSDTNIALKEGESQIISVIYNVDGGGSADATSSDDSVAKCEWYESHGNEVQIKITAVSSGNATVTVTGDGTDIKIPFYVTVTDPDMDKVRVSLPSTPAEVSSQGYEQTAEITNISYSVVGGYYDTYDIRVDIAGRKTYDKDGYNSVILPFILKSGTKNIKSDAFYSEDEIYEGDDFSAFVFIRGLSEGDYTLTFTYPGGHEEIKRVVNVTLPSTPLLLDEKDYGDGDTAQTVKITKLTYDIREESEGEYDVIFYMDGEKTYASNESDGLFSFKWKLKSDDGYIAASGSELFPDISSGEKFKNQEYITDEVPAGNYTLLITADD